MSLLVSFEISKVQCILRHGVQDPNRSTKSQKELLHCNIEQFGYKGLVVRKDNKCLE